MVPSIICLNFYHPVVKWKKRRKKTLVLIHLRVKISFLLIYLFLSVWFLMKFLKFNDVKVWILCTYMGGQYLKSVGEDNKFLCFDNPFYTNWSFCDGSRRWYGKNVKAIYFSGLWSKASFKIWWCYIIPWNSWAYDKIVAPMLGK